MGTVQGNAEADLLLGTWRVRGFEIGLPRVSHSCLEGGFSPVYLAKDRNHLKLVRFLKSFLQHIAEA